MTAEFKGLVEQKRAELEQSGEAWELLDQAMAKIRDSMPQLNKLLITATESYLAGYQAGLKESYQRDYQASLMDNAAFAEATKRTEREQG